MNERLSILVDLDGIVTDLIKAMLDIHVELTGEQLDHGAVVDYEFGKCPAFAKTFQVAYQRLGAPGFFLTLQPIPGAIEGVKALHEDHDVTIITALPYNALAWTAAEDKLRWCAEHMPFIKPRDIVFANSAKKHFFRADVLIDDHPMTLERYAKAWPRALRTGILYDYNSVALPHADLVPGWTNFAGAWFSILDLVTSHHKSPTR